jgi:hypothetical protein
MKGGVGKALNLKFQLNRTFLEKWEGFVFKNFIG